jgi:hypothetical protein
MRSQPGDHQTEHNYKEEVMLGAELDEGLAFLKPMVGRWMLTGMMGDVPLRQEVSCEPTLGGKFLRLYFKSATPPENPTWDYEAVYHIGFNNAEGLFVMHLLDTTEVPTTCAVGLGRRDGDRICFLFEYGGTRFLNTLVRRDAGDVWRFLQTYEEGDTMRTFAKKEMIRIFTTREGSVKAEGP